MLSPLLDRRLTEQMIIYLLFSVRYCWNIYKIAKGDRTDWLCWNKTLWWRTTTGFDEHLSLSVSEYRRVIQECWSSKFTPNLSSANHGRRWEDPVSKVAVSKVIPSCRHPQDGGGANFRGNTRNALCSILFGFYCTHSVKDSVCNQSLWKALINAAAIFSSFTHGLNYECDVICLLHVGPRDVHY